MIDKHLNHGRHHISNFLKKSLPFQTVLDLGAGTGEDLMLAKQQNPQAQLYALENFEPFVHVLEGKGVTVFSLNLEKDVLPFPNESVDVIIVNQLFEHVKEVFWIMHEISRILKVGGHLIIGVPNLASLHNRLLLLLGRQPTSIQNNSAHVRGYTRGDFRKLLESGFPDGYHLAEYGGGNFYPFPPILAKPLAQFFPKMAWGLFMHLHKEKPYTEEGYIRYPVEKQLQTNFYTGVTT